MNNPNERKTIIRKAKICAKLYIKNILSVFSQTIVYFSKIKIKRKTILAISC